MIAKCSVEFDARLQQRSIGFLELPGVIPRILAAVQVVAHHEHELERKLRASVCELLRDVALMLVPVPVSPMTANLIESGFPIGLSWRASTEAASAHISNVMQYSTHGSPPLPNGVRNEVDDDVRVDVAQNQVLADDPVLDILRKLRQSRQKVRRNRGQRLPSPDTWRSLSTAPRAAHRRRQLLALFPARLLPSAPDTSGAGTAREPAA